MTRLTIEIRLEVDAEDAPAHPLLDDGEIAQMLDNTRAQITRRIEAKLGGLAIPLAQQPLRVLVTGVYALATEQMELSYHIDTDDRELLLRAVSALNH